MNIFGFNKNEATSIPRLMVTYPGGREGYVYDMSNVIHKVNEKYGGLFKLALANQAKHDRLQALLPDTASMIGSSKISQIPTSLFDFASSSSSSCSSSASSDFGEHKSQNSGTIETNIVAVDSRYINNGHNDNSAGAALLSALETAEANTSQDLIMNSPSFSLSAFHNDGIGNDSISSSSSSRGGDEKNIDKDVATIADQSSSSSSSLLSST